MKKFDHLKKISPQSFSNPHGKAPSTPGKAPIGNHRKNKRMWSVPGLILIAIVSTPLVLLLVSMVFFAVIGSIDNISQEDLASLNRAWEATEQELLHSEHVRARELRPVAARPLEIMRVDSERAGVRYLFQVACYVICKDNNGQEIKGGFWCVVTESDRGVLRVTQTMGPQVSIGDAITFLVDKDKDQARIRNRVHHIYERVDSTGISTVYTPLGN